MIVDFPPLRWAVCSKNWCDHNRERWQAM